MKTRRTFIALSLAVLVSAALPAAARSVEDGLSLLPPDAAAVGMVRFADLRSNPLGERLFRDFDGATVDGDAARFLEEAHLRLTQDVDTMTWAALPAANGMKDGKSAVFDRPVRAREACRGDLGAWSASRARRPEARTSCFRRRRGAGIPGAALSLSSVPGW